MDNGKLLARAKQSLAALNRWNATLRDVFDFTAPERDPDADRDLGAACPVLFDSTILVARRRFANRLASQLTPDKQRWMELVAGPLVPEGQREQLNRQLRQDTDMIMSAIHVSNFASSIHEAYLDLSISQMIMLIEEGDDRQLINFITVPATKWAVERLPNGQVIGLFGCWQVQAQLIADEWPDADLGAILEQLAVTKPDELVPLHACYVRDKGGFWTYRLIHEASSHVLREQRYRKQPFVACAWSRRPGQPQGYGPVLDALPDVKTLNKVVEFVLKNAALAISGIYTYQDDDSFNPNTVTADPGAMWPVAHNAGGSYAPTLAPLNTNRNFDVAQLLIDRLQMSIKKIMLDDQLPHTTGNPRSALEIAERIRDLAEDIGGSFGRLMNEAIVPIVERTADILDRKGLLNAVTVDQLLIKVNILSPLGRLQDVADIDQLIKYLQIVQTFGGQEALMLATKFEDLWTWLGTKMGIDAALLRDAAGREQVQKMVGAMIAQQQQAQQAQQAAPPPPPPPGADVVPIGRAA
jgi:hypothetical protein